MGKWLIILTMTFSDGTVMHSDGIYPLKVFTEKQCLEVAKMWSDTATEELTAEYGEYFESAEATCYGAGHAKGSM